MIPGEAGYPTSTHEYMYIDLYIHMYIYTYINHTTHEAWWGRLSDIYSWIYVCWFTYTYAYIHIHKPYNTWYLVRPVIRHLLMNICILIYIYICTYIFINNTTHDTWWGRLSDIVLSPVCVCVYVWVCVRMCMRAYVYACVKVCVSVCVHVRAYEVCVRTCDRETRHMTYDIVSLRVNPQISPKNTYIYQKNPRNPTTI